VSSSSHAHHVVVCSLIFGALDSDVFELRVFLLQFQRKGAMPTLVNDTSDWPILMT
jgi:hypothetical protein